MKVRLLNKFLTTTLLISIFLSASYYVIFALTTNYQETGASKYDLQYLQTDTVFSPEELLLPKTTYLFNTLSGNVLPLALNSHQYWVRFKIRQPSLSLSGAAYYLEIANPRCKQLELFSPISESAPGKPRFERSNTGLDSPVQKRDVISNNLIIKFPDSIKQGEFYYLQVTSRDNRIPLFIWRGDLLGKHVFWSNISYGAFYGILLVLLIFDAFGYMLLRDKTYLTYFFYISSMFLFQLSWNGHLLFLKDIPQSTYSLVLSLFTTLVTLSAIMFTRTFFKISSENFHLDRIMKLLMVLSFVPLVLGFISDDTLMYKIAYYLEIIGPLVIIIIAAHRSHYGFEHTRYYWVAYLAFAFGTTGRIISIYSSLSFHTEYANLIGTALEFIFLALSLGDRIIILRETSDSLQKSEQYYRHLSLTDGLTKINNRVFLQTYLPVALSHAEKSQGPLSIAMIDVDNFKKYNDSFGHPEGDQLLIVLAQILKRSIRLTDEACRYGGEEFVLILPGADINEAFIISERIRLELCGHVFTPMSNERIQVTMSIGIAQAQPGEKHDSLLYRADNALYIAKKSGKNQTSIAKG